MSTPDVMAMFVNEMVRVQQSEAVQEPSPAVLMEVEEFSDAASTVSTTSTHSLPFSTHTCEQVGEHLRTQDGHSDRLEGAWSTRAEVASPGGAPNMSWGHAVCSKVCWSDVCAKQPLCLICKDVLAVPFLAGCCGKSFCGSCVQRLLEASEEDPMCPHCRTSFTAQAPRYQRDFDDIIVQAVSSAGLSVNRIVLYGMYSCSHCIMMH